MRGDGGMGGREGHGRARVHRGAWGNMGTGKGTARWGWDLGEWRGHSRVMLKTRGKKTWLRQTGNMGNRHGEMHGDTESWWAHGRCTLGHK